MRQTLRWAFLSVLVLVGGVAIWQVRDVLLLTLTSVLLTVLLSSPVRWLVRRRVPRPLAVLIALIGMTGLFVLLMALVLPQIVTQFSELIKLIPQAVVALRQRIVELDIGINLDAIPEDPNALFEQLLNNLGPISAFLFPQLFPLFGSVTSVLLSILIVGFMSMYFLFDPGMHERGLVSLVPVRYRPRAWEIVARLDRTLRGYLQAKVTSMVLVGLGTGVGLFLLGVNFAGALGIITGLFSFVPNFGPLIALIPTLAATIISAPDRLLWVIVLFYGIQLVESQFVGPLLVSHEINLPPVLVLASQIVCVVFFGFLGLLLSVPLTAIAQVLVQEIYVKDILGDRGAEAVQPPRPKGYEAPYVVPEFAAAPPGVAPNPQHGATPASRQPGPAASEQADEVRRPSAQPPASGSGTPQPQRPRRGQKT